MTELREFSEHFCEPLLVSGYLPGTFSSDSCTRVGVSASLLSWRDAWYLHGWNGEVPLPPELANNLMFDLRRFRPSSPVPSSQISVEIGRHG